MRSLGGRTIARAFRAAKGKRPSQTPGRSKSENCKADKTKKIMAKLSKSYKLRGYNDWCKKMDKANQSRMG